MRRMAAGWIAGLLMVLALGGCSYESHVESQMPKEDRSFIMRFLQALETEDTAKVQAVAGGSFQYQNLIADSGNSVRLRLADPTSREITSRDPLKKNVFEGLIPKGAQYRFLSYSRLQNDGDVGSFTVQVLAENGTAMTRFTLTAIDADGEQGTPQRIRFYRHDTRPNLSAYDRDKDQYETWIHMMILIGIIAVIIICGAIWLIIRELKQRRKMVTPIASPAIIRGQ